MMNDELRTKDTAVVTSRSHVLTFIIHHSSLIIFALTFLTLSFAPAPLPAQVIRLPAVAPADDAPPGQLVSHPDSSSEILQAPGQLDVAPATPPPGEPQLPPGVRNGFFQKLLFDSTWLAAGGADGMGCDDLHLEAIFAAPCPTIKSPLVLTPGFAVHYLQGPTNVDLPPRLYDSYLQFRWLCQATPQWGLDLAVTPGVYSDFDQESSKAFRVTSHAAVAYNWNDKTKLVLGAAYLDRPDEEVIPIGGVVWTPSDDWKFDLLFPHPIISRRVCFPWDAEGKSEHWAYLACEFWGDAWAMKRTDGLTDQVVLSDCRIILGLEHKVPGGLGSRVEVGYVFDRRIRCSDGSDFYPTPTLMLRGGLTY
jgi:hypothetical protein